MGYRGKLHGGGFTPFSKSYLSKRQQLSNMRKLLIGLILVMMVASVSATECPEDQVPVDKVDEGGQECIPEPPSPFNALESFWEDTALQNVYNIMSDYTWI